MKSLIVSLFVLAGIAANACPTLSGSWACVNDNNAREVLPFQASNDNGTSVVTVNRSYPIDLVLSKGNHPEDEYFSYSVACDQKSATLTINGIPRMHMPITMIYKLTLIAEDQAQLQTSGTPTASQSIPGKNYSCSKTASANAL